VSVNVEDVDAALDFYVGALGLTARDDRPDFGFGGAWLDAGGQQVHLIAAPPPENRGQHFALLVDDLDETVSELRAQGVQVSDPSPVASSRQAFCSDPAGNQVELHQVG
jgi:glyoxylase I family protein